MIQSELSTTTVSIKKRPFHCNCGNSYKCKYKEFEKQKLDISKCNTKQIIDTNNTTTFVTIVPENTIYDCN